MRGLPSLPFRRPKRNESGSITDFSLVVLVGMIATGGLAVDAIYFEGKRVAAQDAMDRCALMAAIAQNRIDGGAETEITASQVASDCMAKSSVGSAGLNPPSVFSQNSMRTVTLSGNYTFDALFPNVGNAASKTYAITARSTQKLPNLELTVAVDINHAAFWNQIRHPLKEFFNTVAAADTGNKVTVNFVPFDKNVHLGELIDRFSTEQRPPFASNANRTCLLLPENSKDDIGIDMSAQYRWSWPVYIGIANNPTSTPLSSGFRYILGTPERNGGLWHSLGEMTKLDTFLPLPTPEFGNCAYTSANNTPLVGAAVARPITTAPTSPINAKIDSIVARGHEDINYANSAEAMKWSLAFMDDSLRSLFASKAADLTASAAAANRPLSYGAEDSLKVLIFVPNNVFRMPDGQITADSASGITASRVREIRPEFLDGTEPAPQIWRTPDSTVPTENIRYSIYHPDAPGPNKYWVTQGHCFASTCAAHWAAAPFQYPGEGAPIAQTWPDIFGAMTIEYLIRQLYMIPLTEAGVLPGNADYHFGSLVDRFTYIETDASRLVQDFEDLCAQAKQNGVLIYTLMGNGVVTRSETGGTAAQRAAAAAHNPFARAAITTYRNCASSPSHSFTVGNAASIKSTLRLIASNIAQLTLSQ